ncbi:MAG: hypothetical protein K1000chlam3_01572 [Chlamydiae bacterium]|nr:hypothetical protein [Chlamydiota bacterium]
MGSVESIPNNNNAYNFSHNNNLSLTSEEESFLKGLKYNFQYENYFDCYCVALEKIQSKPQNKEFKLQVEKFLLDCIDVTIKMKNLLMAHDMVNEVLSKADLELKIEEALKDHFFSMEYQINKNRVRNTMKEIDCVPNLDHFEKESNANAHVNKLSKEEENILQDLKGFGYPKGLIRCRIDNYLNSQHQNNEFKKELIKLVQFHLEDMKGEKHFGSALNWLDLLYKLTPNLDIETRKFFYNAHLEFSKLENN